MKKHALAFAISLTLGSQANVEAAFWDSPDVVDYQNKAIQDEYREIINAPDVCDVLSAEACDLLIKKPDFTISHPKINTEDRKILTELLVLSNVTEGGQGELPDGRKAILRNSAITLGFQVGMAMEAARFNRIWDEYEEVYENIDFSALLIEQPGGRNIVPPVVTVMGDSREVGSGGRVFRIAETVYRIKRQPRFSIEAPTWRDYLHIKIDRPDRPVSGLLPQNKAEAEFWRIQLVKGYANGISTARDTVEAQYRELTLDYIGMVTYHLLRTYNMISEPVVETTVSPVVLTNAGMAMAIDDTISVLSVRPQLSVAREQWKVYPQLQKLSAIQRNLIERNSAYAY
jgi:hypothetical protein